jgi:hypothetical protein
MAKDTEELRSETQLFFCTSNLQPTPRQDRAVRKIGGILVHRSVTEFLGDYDIWERCHRPLGEPLAGSLVRSAVKLNTGTDRLADIVGRVAEETDLGRYQSIARKLGALMASDPELSADSIQAYDLASLIRRITIRHPAANQELYLRRQLLANNDPADPDFQQQLLAMAEEEGNSLAGLATYPELICDFYTLECDEVMVPTTPQAAKQLAREAKIFGFSLSQTYL